MSFDLRKVGRLVVVLSLALGVLAIFSALAAPVGGVGAAIGGIVSAVLVFAVGVGLHEVADIGENVRRSARLHLYAVGATGVYRGVAYRVDADGMVVADVHGRGDEVMTPAAFEVAARGVRPATAGSARRSPAP